MQGPMRYAIYGTLLAALSGVLAWFIFRGENKYAFQIGTAMLILLVSMFNGGRGRFCFRSCGWRRRQEEEA